MQKKWGVVMIKNFNLYLNGKKRKIIAVVGLALVTHNIVDTNSNLEAANSNFSVVAAMNNFEGHMNEYYKTVPKYDVNKFSSLATYFNIDVDVINEILLTNEEQILSSDNKYLALVQLIDEQYYNKEAVFQTATNNSRMNRINEVKSTEIGDLYIKYGTMYGIDPELLMAKAAQESNLSHSSFRPDAAYGISQIENTLFGSNITAYNFNTNSYDTVTITEAGARDLETNIMYGTMRLQNTLNNYNGNVPLALQHYNFGYSMTVVLKNLSAEQGVDVESIINDPTNTTWLPAVEYYHNNYFGDGRTYGDDKYASKIIGNLSDKYITIKNVDTQEEIILNVETGDKLIIDETIFENTPLYDTINNELIDSKKY